MTSPASEPETETAAVPEPMTGEARPVVIGRLGWRDTFSALKHRNFRLFFFGQLISLAGTWMQNTAQGWLVYQITGSKLLLGVVAAASSAPMVVFSIWGGWIADHYPKRSTLVATQTASMLLAFAMWGLVWTGIVRPWEIVIIGALGGVVMAFDMPARQAFIVEMTSRDELMNAISLNSSIFNGARIMGPALAGLLMARVGLASCFFINGISFIAVIIGLVMMRLPAHVRPVSAEGALQQALSGFSHVWENFRVRVLMGLLGILGVFGWSYSVLMPAFARDVLNVGERGYGILLASGGVGALAAALILATAGQRVSRRKLVFGGIWLSSGMLALFAFTRVFWLSLVFQAGISFGMILFFSTANTLIQTSVPDEMRGRVMGIWALIFGAMVPLGSMEAGWLAHVAGISVTMVSGALVCAVAGGVTLWIVRRRDAAKT